MSCSSFPSKIRCASGVTGFRCLSEWKHVDKLPKTSEDPRHWTMRIWTLQLGWLPGWTELRCRKRQWGPGVAAREARIETSWKASRGISQQRLCWWGLRQSRIYWAVQPIIINQLGFPKLLKWVLCKIGENKVFSDEHLASQLSPFAGWASCQYQQRNCRSCTSFG